MSQSPRPPTRPHLPPEKLGTHAARQALFTALHALWPALLGFAGLLLVATLGYVLMGWPWTDAIFMTVISVFSVGYDEVQPLDTTAERAWTMMVIFAGYIALVATLAGLVESLQEGQLHEAQQKWREARRMNTFHDHVIICGYGRVGQALAKRLQSANGELRFVIIDRNPNALQRAEDDGFGQSVRCADATEEQTLREAGIERCCCLAIVLPDDVLNVFITLTARQLLQSRALRIIARAERPSTAAKLKQAGADDVVLPATLGGESIANLILQANAPRIW